MFLPFLLHHIPFLDTENPTVFLIHLYHISQCKQLISTSNSTMKSTLFITHHPLSYLPVLIIILPYIFSTTLGKSILLSVLHCHPYYYTWEQWLPSSNLQAPPPLPTVFNIFFTNIPWHTLPYTICKHLMYTHRFSTLSQTFLVLLWLYFQAYHPFTSELNHTNISSNLFLAIYSSALENIPSNYFYY